MKTLQELLDAYGASCGCSDWDGWVRECVQHPEMVVNKFNEIVTLFKEQSEKQINNALGELKEKCYKDNWCQNKAHYHSLLGDSETSDKWVKAIGQ